MGTDDIDLLDERDIPTEDDEEMEIGFDSPVAATPKFNTASDQGVCTRGGVLDPIPEEAHYETPDEHVLETVQSDDSI